MTPTDPRRIAAIRRSARRHVFKRQNVQFGLFDFLTLTFRFRYDKTERPCLASSPARSGMNRRMRFDEIACPCPTFSRPRMLVEITPLMPMTSPDSLKSGPPGFRG